MTRTLFPCLLLAVTAALAATPMETGLVTLRVRFGLKDAQPAKWDGEVRVTGGEVARIEGWRFGKEDKVEGAKWTASTRRMMPNNPFQQRIKPADMPASDNGVLVTLKGATPASRVEVTTAQGKLEFTLADVPFGKTLPALDGNADVQRVPPTWQLTNASQEEDFPAAAAATDGTVHAAYIAFTHGKNHLTPQKISEEPKDYSNLAEPTGGEQVMLLTLKNGQWSAPVEIAKADDTMKCAVAVNAQGQPCVIWSERRGANFDLYANVAGKTSRLTTDAGPDIAPVAASDAQGRVWIAWMAGRKSSFDIHVARLDGDKLSDEQTLGASPANEWNPAIAAAKNGEIAVAWDTYAKGDYDVFFATAKDVHFGAPVAVAASAKMEARPAIAYDGDGRLWVAWEEGDELWGKDSGALIQDKGRGLYRSRVVRCKVFAGGKPHRVVADIDAARPPRPNYGPLARPVNKAGVDTATVEIVKPGPKAAQQPIPWDQPRLATDASGRVWLAFRARSQNFPNTAGNTWYEHVTTCDGERWLPAVHVPHTDNYLDNKPAFVAAADRLLLVSAADGRHAASGLAGRNPQGRVQSPPPRADGTPAVNNDIWVAEIAGFNGAAPKLEPCEPEKPAEITATTKAERDDVKCARSYRAKINGQQFRLMRGEFHRHTELSQDGMNDGSLQDMWRYALDASAMDWIGNGDHDNGAREYPWWLTQKTTDAYLLPGAFVPMFSYERSNNYPDGHRNVVFAQRGVRTLPRLQGGMGKDFDGKLDDNAERPHTPDTQMLYKYLSQFNGICALHTCATDQGSDWRDNNPKVEPCVEIYQGCRQSYERPDGPRHNTPDYSISGWRPLGFVSRALMKGYRLGFQSSSDHGSTHISFCNLWTTAPTREAMLEAFQKRRLYGSTDNILADVRCIADGREYFMGEEFTAKTPPKFRIKLAGTAPFAKVTIVRDNEYVHVTEPKTREVEFEWTDSQPVAGKTSYYYVRGDQVPSAPDKDDGEIVWVSPMWVSYAK